VEEEEEEEERLKLVLAPPLVLLPLRVLLRSCASWGRLLLKAPLRGGLECLEGEADVLRRRSCLRGRSCRGVRLGASRCRSDLGEGEALLRCCRCCRWG